jgi:hypothetical protein
MFQRILEALVSGHSSRQIATWCVPPVAHSTINNYNRTHVRPILHNADQIKALLTANKVQNTALPPELQSFTDETQVDDIARQAILGTSVMSVRENRINAKQERLRRLAMIVNGRAVDMAGIPGGESGFLVRDFKGSGDSLQEINRFDSELFKAFDETEKNIAIELGQWQENATGSVSIQIVCPAAPAGQSPKIVFGDQTLTLEAGAVEHIDDDPISEIGLLQTS